jgi:hypothetical protein
VCDWPENEFACCTHPAGDMWYLWCTGSAEGPPEDRMLMLGWCGCHGKCEGWAGSEWSGCFYDDLECDCCPPLDMAGF